MLIDPKATLGGQVSQPPLSPELEQLVTDLKARLGQRLDAVVNRTLVVTEAERRQLLDLHSAAPNSAAQRQLKALLQDPALKLVELKVQQQTVPTLTNLPLRQAQSVQVLVTAKGLVVLPPNIAGSPAAPSTTSPGTLATPAVAPPAALAATLPVTGGIPVTRSSAATPAPVSATAANIQSGSTPAPGPPRTDTAAAPVAPAVSSTRSSIVQAPGTLPEANMAIKTLTLAPEKTSASSSTAVQVPGGPSNTSPSGRHSSEFSAQPMATSGKTANVSAASILASTSPSLKSAEVTRPLLASALARTLPMAQELSPLLRAVQHLNQQLQQVPEGHRSSFVPALRTLLHQLPSLSLDVAQLNPARPLPLQQAIQQSGVFYEHKLLDLARTETGTRDLASMPERDLKGMLIQLQQWLAAPQALTIPARTSMPDALAQMFLGLAQLFSPRQRSQSEVPPAKQLAAAIQQLVDRSLARIQTQQYRNVNSQLFEPASPQQWHLDIPLRLPEGYGNLYLQIFEPRVPPEPEKGSEKPPRPTRRSRWRVFMELTLDEMGGLAAEISVLDDNLEVTLWAEQNDLRERANAHLQTLKQDLEQQGLTVQELRCSQNPPPAQKMQLDYALIDIKT